MLGGDGAGLVDSGTGEGIVGKAIDVARHTLCGLEQGLDGWRFEQRQFTAGPDRRRWVRYWGSSLRSRPERW